MRIKSLLWMGPFICFMAGYCVIQSYFGNRKTTVPVLLGKPLNQAVCLLSEHMLAPRIVAEKEDSRVPAGTVIQQKPEPHTSIRWHQTVMLTVSKLPDPILVPFFIGNKIADIVPQLTKMGLQSQVYELPSAHAVQGVCLAQWPSGNQEIKPDGKVILYAVAKIQKPYIVPDFRGKNFEEVKHVCEQYGISCQVVHAGFRTIEQMYDASIIKDQRPLPGTLLMLDVTKKLLFQFQV
ncbi:PASTA domain-containing protein [Candidatus Dependentiae bacterium]|nr:PASTA domain-containing protein [Candidatus Dependentiae bacterium]